MTKRKYPKAFYDDGLGDILEFIDDEILSKSKPVEPKKNRIKNDKSDSKQKTKSTSKNQSLYGDNDISEEKYKPPKRVHFDSEDEKESNQDKKLIEKTRGLLNRLAAQTMPYVTSELEKLYSTHPRNMVTKAIIESIESSVIHKNSIAKRKLVAELMLLISYLDHKISHAIGALFVHQMIRKFECFYTSSDCSDKQIDNVLICLVNLYQTGLLSCHNIFEVTKRICSADIKPKSVELLLIILKGIGLELRKDDPTSMRQLIIKTQEICQTLKSENDIDSRLEFMMEALSAIKNNNVNKLGNYGCDIDKDAIQSTMKVLLKRSKLPESLNNASYEEILNSPNWYLLDIRAHEADEVKVETNDKKESTKSVGGKTEDKICKALGFNKPAEKTIFGALLRVSDYVEASNVLIGFGLNHCSDAMLVCIHIAIFEKKYNPFYYNIVNQLCKFNRRYKMAAKFTIQDKIRVLGKMPTQRVNNFQKLCFELIKSDSIPITILKSIEWADLSESTKQYLIYLLDNISELPAEERIKVMSKVEKKSSFAGAMKTFINCFMKGCKLFQ